MSKRLANSSIDIMKFLCAFLVIAIHTRPFQEFNWFTYIFVTNYLARIAVPFFFATAGYFFTKRLIGSDRSISVFLNYTKRLFFLYLGWCMIYFPFDFPIVLQYASNYLEAVLKYLRNFIFLGAHFHLWFFPALFFSICLLYLALRTHKLNLLLIFSLIIYLIGTYGQSYYGLITNQFMLSFFDSSTFMYLIKRNGVHLGLFFVCLGGYIAGKERKSFFRFTHVHLILSFILLFIEVYILEYNEIVKFQGMYIAMIPLIYILLNFLLMHQVNLDQKVSLFLRRASTGIYFVHGLYLILFSKLFERLGIIDVQTWMFLLISITSFLTISLLIKCKIPFLKKLV